MSNTPARNRNNLSNRRLQLEKLDARQLLAADASLVWQDLDSQPLIGETIDVAVNFQNAGTSTGYGPYVDLVVPGDGLEYVRQSASLLDNGVRETLVSFDVNGQAVHPFALQDNGKPIVLKGNPNDQLVVFELPFGSYTPDQPALQMNLQLAVDSDADVGQSLHLVTASGFRYGEDATDNPAIDPMTRSNDAKLSITPGIIATKVEYLGPENETATGENYLRSYRVSFDIAEDAVVQNLQLISQFDSNQIFRGVHSQSWDDDSLLFNEGVSDLVGKFASRLVLNADSLRGVPGIDGSFTVDFVVPKLDSESELIAGIIDGSDGLSTIAVDASGELLVTQATESVSAETVKFIAVPATHELQNEVLTVQQDVRIVEDKNASSWGPGDVVEYTIKFQVSDYAVLDSTRIQFTVPDGQRFDTDTAVTMAIHGLAASDTNSRVIRVKPATSAPTRPGTQTYIVNVSDELSQSGLSGRLHGGATKFGSGYALTGTLVYRAVIQDDFTGKTPSGDASVDEGDLFQSAVFATAITVDQETGLPTKHFTTDDSGTRVTMKVAPVTTSVYAINGAPASHDAAVSAGDLVTYKISRQVRSGDVEDLVLSSYMPLPIFSIGKLDWASGDGSIPGENEIQFGSNDNFRELLSEKPSLAIDSGNNSLSVDFGDVDWIANADRTIELLVTVRVEDQPFADGMWLTELANSEQGSTNNGNFTSFAAANVQYTRPVLSIIKSAVGSDNKNAKLIDTDSGTDIRNVDAGDFVQFETIIKNNGLGRNGAFDVSLSDSIPAGFKIPSSGLQLKILNGADEPLEFFGGEKDLFADGLKLKNPIPSAQINEKASQVVIRYQLVVEDSHTANTSTSSVASVNSYAAVAGGENYATSDLSDSATATTANASIVHARIDTDQPHTSGGSVVVGETVTFKTTVKIPEGRMENSSLTIEAPRGFAINSLISATASKDIAFASLKASELIDSATIESSSDNVRDGGNRLRFEIGDLTNENSDNQQFETIEVVYTATVTNDPSSHAGKTLRNTAVWSHSNGKTAIKSNSVRLYEPKLSVAKSWSQPEADAADRVTVTLDIVPDAGWSTTAFDVALAERLPTGATYVPNSVRWVSGAEPKSFAMNDGLLTATWNSFSRSSTARIEYEIEIHDDSAAGTSLTSDATITWSSLPGEPGQIAATNQLSYERTGNASDVGGNANDYRGSYQSSLKIAPVKIDMELIESSHTHTSGDAITIGERAIYEITLTVPEGVHRLSINGFDSSSNANLTLETLTIQSVGSNIGLSHGGIDTQVLANTEGLLSIDFGTVTNRADNQSNDSDKIVLRMVTLIENDPRNEQGDIAVAAVTADYQLGSSSAEVPVRIVEPRLELTQSVSATNVEADAVVDAVISIVHHQELGRATNGPNAFELNLSESLSKVGLSLVPGSVEVTNGRILSGNATGDDTVQVELDESASNSPLQVNYQVRVARDAAPGASFQLNPTLTYASISGDEAREYIATTSTNISVNATDLVGQVFVDANQDGIEQVGDRGIGGVQVTLTGVDHLGNSIIRKTKSLASGHFEFLALRPGTYSLIQEQPLGISDGMEFVGSKGGVLGDNRIDNIVIETGSSGIAAGYRFTESPLTWIEGTVFVDENEDSVLGKDERGIENVQITLMGLSTSGESVELTTLTNNRGYYVFGHLEPGTYSIIEGPTEGYFDANEQLGTVGGILSNDAFSEVTVTATEPGKMYNFGEYKPGSVTGQIYIDYDRDLILDRKDGLVAGVEVRLRGTNDLGESIETTTYTDVDGFYRFDGLRPGIYAVESDSIAGLESSVSNVGVFLGGFSTKDTNGIAIENGFEQLTLPAGATAIDYNIGHSDPFYDPSIQETKFASQVAFNGTHDADRFVVSFTSTGAAISVNEDRYYFEANETRSIRLLGSFGNDTLEFTGSENKEEINLREHSARITGTWFETLVYGMENIQFIGGGNEDLARFYDTSGDDSFMAEPFNATMSGDGYKNSVEDVHRIYAYMTEGDDDVTMIGQKGRGDNFSATPREAKLYGSEFYLYAGGFDSAIGSATDPTDRAYLYGSEGDDHLTATETSTSIKSDDYKLIANGFAYVLASAKEGGFDTANLTGSQGNDSLVSRPTQTTFDIGDRRVIAKSFESIDVFASNGDDIARVYDSHYNDKFIADSNRATISNSVNTTTMVEFETVYAYMNAGGEDVAVLRGSHDSDTFKASPDKWSMQGGGSYLYGTGFTSVTAYGNSNDKAYLYDSAFDDTLELTQGKATMYGQRYSNTVSGFGKINAEASYGNDRIKFHDTSDRSTVRLNEEKATIFGKGFSYNATGFDSVDAYYSDLEGRDNVELDGRIDYDLLAIDVADAKFKLSLEVNEDAQSRVLKTAVKYLS